MAATASALTRACSFAKRRMLVVRACWARVEGVGASLLCGRGCGRGGFDVDAAVGVDVPRPVWLEEGGAHVERGGKSRLLELEFGRLDAL